jgi:hypothetical protein
MKEKTVGLVRVPTVVNKERKLCKTLTFWPSDKKSLGVAHVTFNFKRKQKVKNLASGPELSAEID